MPSGWLEGTIRHRRKYPVQHEFTYQIGMLALDLDEWPGMAKISPWLSLGAFNWLGLYREDYLDPQVPSLRQAVVNRVEAATGWEPDGPIELLTHPRYLGYVFNPVSFYLCYSKGHSAARGDVPSVILAQITNTPWKQRHLYCLECCQPGPANPENWHTERFMFSKRFHVSPFNGMDQHYQWLFSFRANQLRIHMNVADSERKHFDATLVVQRRYLDRTTLHRSLMKFPLETLKGTAGIYWNALRLKLKGAVFHNHPDKLEPHEPDYQRGLADGGLDITDISNPEQNESITAGRVSSWRT